MNNNKKELMHFFYSGNYESDRKNAEKLRIIFKKYLKENPYDTEIWLKFILLLYLAPLHEDLGAIKCIEKVLEYDPHNVKALLLLYYIHEHIGTAELGLFEKVSNFKTSDSEIQSMIEYGKSWYYQDNDNYDNYEQCLIRSIELCNKHVSNYISLGQYYLIKGKLTQGSALMKKGLSNVKNIIDDDYKYNALDIEEFFNERFKGIHITDINYGIIIESFNPTSPWVTGDFITKKDNNNLTEN